MYKMLPQVVAVNIITTSGRREAGDDADGTSAASDTSPRALFRSLCSGTRDSSMDARRSALDSAARILRGMDWRARIEDTKGKGLRRGREGSSQTALADSPRTSPDLSRPHLGQNIAGAIPSSAAATFSRPLTLPCRPRRRVQVSANSVKRHLPAECLS